MTPTEVTTLLRQFNEWRRSEDETVEQPDTREVSEAIDAAVEMIERLEAAEKERDELRNEIACVKEVEFPRKAQAVADAWKGKCERLEAERDALRAKIERMEKHLLLILEEPENTMSNGKAMREMLRQARLALEESK